MLQMELIDNRNQHLDNRLDNRWRRSVVLNHCDDESNLLCLKWANTRDELEKAFRLVYEEYVSAGYIKDRNPPHMYFNLHNLLPDTATLVLNHQKNVVSTLSVVEDSTYFGLPMDTIYHFELDQLRLQKRKIVEFSSLATAKTYRWNNIYAFLFREAYWHAIENNANDICITVNPKHVRFYKAILLFEDLGHQKFYPRVGAPAVALRMNTDSWQERLKEAYDGYTDEYNWYRFIFENREVTPKNLNSLIGLENGSQIDDHAVTYFIHQNRENLTRLSSEQWNYFFEARPNLGATIGI